MYVNINGKRQQIVVLPYYGITDSGTLSITLHAGDTLCVESYGQSTDNNYGYIQIKVEIK